ncbi:MAG: sensor histidine kinase [Omnitrophica WOR_2 bacterium]
MDNSNENPVTYYAPAEIAPLSQIETSYHALKNNPLLRMFQEAMPDLAMIINSNRQLVYANSNLIKFLDIEDVQVPLGKRLGNLLSCIHSDEQPSGCGTTKACRFCGVVNAIIESQQTNKPVIKEARITAFIDDEVSSYDLKVKASPLIFKEEDYTIISINDISDRKRRAILETSYINEMYGTASELKEVVSSIKKEELNSDARSLVENAEKVNYELMSDLLAQKMLSEAEEGTLTTKLSITSSLNILRELDHFFATNEVAAEKRLFIDPFSHNIRFQTDVTVLKRALINIITNAYEAVTPDMLIKVSVKLNDTTVKFSVFSPVELTEEAKHQMFQRSFSTKAANRGIGTYTARLLTTKYLKGKLYFTSDKKGTSFFIEVPLHLD